ncbi:MAG: hypothetical protein QOG63_506 [Thermoleophilaceae bacterium]|nr:hypothetical protein [Thermoleophilaceae bacterium]
MLIGVPAALRAAFGIVVVAAPTSSVLGPAPEVDDRPSARLFVRAHSAHHAAVGLAGLASLRRSELRRPSAVATLLADLTDLAAGLVEARARGGVDRDLVPGIAFPATGVLVSLATLHAL